MDPAAACRGARVLVTGGAGFIGSHVCERALAAGAARVTVLDNLVSGKRAFVAPFGRDPRFAFVEGDVRDAGTVRRLVGEADLVVHEAASKLVVSRENPRVDLETNVLGTFNVLEAARGRDVRVVHASTGSVLGSVPEGEMREDHPKRPTTLYGISKGTGEAYVLFYAQEFGVRAAAVRYFHVFGPRQDHRGNAGVISIFLGRALRGEPLAVHGTGAQIRCFTYVGDTVDATFLAAAHPEAVGKVFNVASRTRLSIRDLAQTVLDRFGAPGARIVHEAERPGENLRPVPDTSRIEALGWRAEVSFDEGLGRTAAWVREDLGLPAPAR